MMFEMILLDNNDKSVTYEVRNHDKNIINTIKAMYLNQEKRLIINLLAPLTG